MTKEQLSDALSMLNDDMIEEADKVRSSARLRRRWVRWGVLAACLCLVLAAALSLMQRHDTAADKEPCEKLTVAEALSYEPFGALFPTAILDGYALENNTVFVFNKAVMKAEYCSNRSDDAMTIIIANKEYFENAERNTVLENGRSGSKIYIASGDHIIAYYFSRRDIRTIEGFEEMVTSAAAFAK